MKTKYFILTLLIIWCSSAQSQISELDNSGTIATSFVGWDAGTTLFDLDIAHKANNAISDINFLTRNTQRMQLNDNGLLGIGLTTQTSLLHLGRTTNSLGSLFRTDGLNNEVTQWQLFTGTTTTSGQTEKYRLW